MGQFVDKTISEVVNELNVSYFLPDIQREYVWLSNSKERKIEQLFDSILRGYPIGSFLFWKIKSSDIDNGRSNNIDKNENKLNFQLYKFIERYDQRKPHNEKINIDQINPGDLNVVLDGQQRLTSLYIGLKGTRTLKMKGKHRNNAEAFKEKKLYLNLKYQPKEDTPDDNYKFEFFEENATPGNSKENFWFKVGDILTTDSINKYGRQNELDDYEIELLEKLKNAIMVHKIISCYLEEEKNLDKVLKIFIRVNSGGTQLSYSDLLMSILTSNFNVDIRTQMNDFVKSNIQDGFSVMGRDQILKSCLLLTGANPEFKLKNFSRDNICKIEEEWKKIIESVELAKKILKDFGYENQLSSAYIISTLALYYFKKRNEKKDNTNEEKDNTNEEKKAILRFVRIAQIQSYFTSSLDTKLGIIFLLMKSSKTFLEFYSQLKNHRTNPLKITEDDIEQALNLKYGEPGTLPILQLLYPNLDYRNKTFHIDHIYPRSKFKKLIIEGKISQDFKDKIDSLFNLQLLEGTINQSKSDSDPEDWIQNHFENDDSKIKEYKKSNYIPEQQKLEWNDDCIGKFEDDRLKLVKEELMLKLLDN